jgi:AraC-like DNA-binding protein
VINEHLKVNFYDFVNGYRVEEAKRLLEDGSHGKKNFLEILYEAGFNTKSAFNRAFKKHAGMTPSQYKSR